MGQGPGPIGSDDRRELRDEETADALLIGEDDLAAVPAGADEAADDETAAIRTDIEQTRAQMSTTIDAITERLSPDNVKEQVKEQMAEQVREVRDTVREATIGKAEDMVRNAGETVSDARAGFVETIKQNPIPAALAGLGLGWLWMNRRSAPSRSSQRYPGRVRYYDYDRDVDYDRERGYYVGRGNTGDVRYGTDRGYGARDVDYQGRSTVSDAASRAGDTVSSAAGQARDTVSSAAGQARDTVSSAAGQV